MAFMTSEQHARWSKEFADLVERTPEWMAADDLTAEAQEHMAAFKRQLEREAAREALKDQLVDIIAEHAHGSYWCNRVWEAWNVGTMSASDFHELNEKDFAHDLAEAILTKLEQK